MSLFKHFRDYNLQGLSTPPRYLLLGLSWLLYPRLQVNSGSLEAVQLCSSANCTSLSITNGAQIAILAIKSTRTLQLLLFTLPAGTWPLSESASRTIRVRWVGHCRCWWDPPKNVVGLAPADPRQARFSEKGRGGRPGDYATIAAPSRVTRSEDMGSGQGSR